MICIGAQPFAQLAWHWAHALIAGMLVVHLIASWNCEHDL